ncbi:hypothetical protein Agub_g3472 [Astrephomene gubernaculifera]|uniref:Glucosidase 2 subunit beta n=1 Tax=Astrephomene gubernaculifera TaxID=47775 RepID=A0AAD3HJ75_9CHLO|nr:hypothetical protein Agub_g3472 [Astrephomene gubernaculifera]
MGTFTALAFLAGLALVHGNVIRGLNPDLASYYSGVGGSFKCISGIAKTIPFARVNDDYCDCPDGSDEPGTSACHNGRFYCRNLGHEPRLLASAFVDDGVCDCCDGTDEPKGKCQNTCLQASAVHREALKNKISQFEQALATKAEYVSKAKAFKQELQLKSSTIDDDVVRQQGVVDHLKGEVTRLEQEEAQRKAHEEAQQAAQQAEQQAAEAQAAQQADQAATEQLEPAAGSAVAEERQLQEGITQETQPEEREETPEERGRRIASQWTNDPAAAAVPGSQGDVNHEEEEEGQQEEGHYDGEQPSGDYSQGAEQPDEGEEYSGQQTYQPPRPDATTPLGEVRARLYDAERLLERLQKDKQDIQTYLRGNLDFGPDDIFLSFADKCFTSYQTRWNYEACFFKNAVQREGYSNSVTVGRWYGFAPDYKTMYFTGGDECWNVGPRSLTVTMSCGMENKLSDGEEPGTCRYAAKFTSPALCTDAEVEELRQQLRNLEAFEQEVRAQIAKDEL